MKACIAALAQLPGVWRGGELERVVHPVVATGWPALDRELPGGGWPMGTLSEVLHDGVGIGEVSFLSNALAAAARDERVVAWIDPPHLPYAPALAQAGVPLERCVVARPATPEDALWAAEQALRSGACGAVLCWFAAKNDYAWLRRLQMAAEAGRARAVHFRGTAAESQSTPALLRLVLSCVNGELRFRIPKRRGPPLVESISLGLSRFGRVLEPPETKPARARILAIA
ncbi:MAG: translesion DNA synthesis-associated protein ImuA [Bacillota bacterium]